MREGRIVIDAPAKLNLALRVIAREHSGFHQIETIFCTLALADTVEVVLTNAGISLEVTEPAPELGPVSQNLAVRAAEAFVRAADIEHGVHITLTKRIPAGAGLGGGSSDAAAVLIALNRLHDEPLSASELLAIGAELGSDVPFLLSGAGLALAWGRGGRILPLSSLPPAAVLLAVPPERVATADAYRAVHARRAAEPELLRAPRTWADVASIAHNDFEETVFAQHPRLAMLRETIEREGALIARLTGSGSVVFGIFEDERAAQAAATAVQSAADDVATILTSTATGSEFYSPLSPT